MDLRTLSSIGIPVGGPVIRLGLPEEVQVSAASTATAKAAPAVASAKSSASSKAAPAPKAKAGTEEKTKEAADGKNFLEKWIEADLVPGGRCDGKKVMTRFPPEPNGYLHIGHAKSILTNFGLAQKFGGQCNLRFDDTNPETEEVEYVESIKDDVCWITQALRLEQCANGGKPWRDSLFFASDYFDQMHAFAVDLIKAGKAYVDSQSAEEVQKNRGGGKDNAPGVDSPFRTRSVEENLRLFAEMQEGKHPEGSMLLRAKISMQHTNMNMRDPPMYRIRFAKHHNTGEKWKIYPIYDFAHGNEDAIEGVTHSICTLEFENHRELYDWFLENTSIIPSRPHQKEFARLEVEGAVTSKRKLLRLVKEGKVTGWDDPRLLTVRGLKRRGVRPEGLKRMCDVVGVTDRNSTQPWELIEDCFRADLEGISRRRLVVLDPLKVEITTYKGSETIDGLPDFPPEQTNTEGLPNVMRSVTMSNEVFIDRSDFVENPPEGYFRLGKIGSEVKLRYSYCIKLEEIVKDKKGNVTLLKCSHDPATRDIIPDRKPKVIQWVDAKNYDECEVRLINKLFNDMPSEMPDGKDFMDYLNPESWILCKAVAEKALAKCEQSHRFQFERCGYFAPDYACFEEPKKLVFNRVVPLKESAGKKKLEGTDNSRKDQQAAQAAEKARLSKIHPKDYFKSEKGDEYSAYDDEGLPTHDKDGTALTKNKLKTLKKDLEKHEKLYKAANP
jgi:glutaminyl-tRNA synthetase